MISRILKYDLDVFDTPKAMKIKISGGEICPIAVAEQNGSLMLWVQTSIADEDAKAVEDREQELVVYVFGTGHSYVRQHNHVHIGTVVMSIGFVWHVFYEKQ